MRNIPTVTKNLLLVNIIAFVATWLLQIRGIDLNDVCGLHYFMAADFHPWQLVTYMFLHSGFMHILFNMFALWMFGVVIENVWGPRKFLFYYISCGIGAGLMQELAQFCSFYLTISSQDPSVTFSELFVIGQQLSMQLNGWTTIGASGAVYAILLAFGMIFPNERIFIFPLPIPIKAKWFVMFYVAIELFSALGWKMPKYSHTAQLMKMDGGSKRKLSKRKDPELALDFYFAEGFPVPSVIEYLLTLLNSNFEEWRLANPKEPYENFKFTTNKMSVSGSLFDLDKLRDVSKNVVSMLTTEQVWSYLTDWAEKYDRDFYMILAADPEYAKSIISIGRGIPKPRKDIAVWSEMKDYMAFFYDELFTPGSEYPQSMSTEEIRTVLEKYKDIYDEADDQTTWFGKIKDLSVSLGYSASPKEYKQNPEAFKGHVGDISAVIRMAVTGRVNSPDMFAVMSVMGKAKVIGRIERAIAAL